MITHYKEVLVTLFITLVSSALFAQCPLPIIGFGGGSAPTPNNSVIIETCNFVGEYETVINVEAFDTYTVNYSGGAGVYVVIYDTTDTPVAWGDTTVQFTAQHSGIYHSAVFIDSTCNTNDPQFTCNASLWTNISSTADLQSEEISVLTVYPNPTNKHVTVSFEGSTADVSITNLQGKVVYANRIQNDDIIDVSSFESGIYLLDAQWEGKREIVRIVRQ